MKAPGLWIVAIGASGGKGLNDICALLAALPYPLAAIVLVVLHRPTDRVSHLQAILARSSRMPVAIAREGERLQPGLCYIGEADAHLTLVAKNLAGLVPDLDNAYRNRTIDLLFHSLAAAAPRVIGVILSGSLDDGARGLKDIHKAGGRVMVMTPDRSHGGQMPANAIDYDGAVDFIGAADEIAATIARTVAGSPATV